MTTAREILDRSSGLPTLPASAAQLLSLLEDPDVNIARLEEVIRPDAALTANLLRAANSAMFALRRPVESVRQAVAMLGLSRVTEIATTASFCRVLEREIPGYAVSATAFWIHNVAVAVYAKRLWRWWKGKDVHDSVFTAGLLHDVGKLAMGAVVHRAFTEIARRMTEEQMAFVEAEAGVIGVDHGAVGALLAETWKFPSTHVETIRWHHHPEAAVKLSCASVVDVVHAADAMAHLFGYGADTGGLHRRIDGEVEQRMAMTARNIEAVAIDSAEEISTLARLFKGGNGKNGL